ncbi:MAG TPA: hypothetical protein VNF50_11050 [Acidimicrobiales bacterium]|nr:hypothetical protein [Acidimicrobiales bacterium]
MAAVLVLAVGVAVWWPNVPADAAPSGTIFAAQSGVGVFSLEASGSTPTLVVPDPHAGSVAAAPDRSAIAYADSAALVVAIPSGAATASIPVGPGQVGSIAWSPDLSTIAFTDCLTAVGPCSLDLVGSTGADQRVVIPSRADGSGVAPGVSWGPAGLVADLVGQAGGTACELCAGVPYSLGTGGSIDSPVLPGSVVQARPGGLVSQSANGAGLAYATGSSPKTDVVQVFSGVGASQPLATYFGYTSPAWSPDGSELVMSDGHQVLEVQPGSGSAPQPIASFNSYGITSLSWAASPAQSGTPGCSVVLQPGAVQGIAADPTGPGYWITDAYGSVSACGAATDYGGAGSTHLNKPVVSISAMSDGGGYRLGAYDGGVLNFGDATAQHGPGTTNFSLSGLTLPSPIWTIASTLDGNGYWLASSDGHVYTFGDARFFGPRMNLHLVAPVAQIVPTTDGQGYWLAASDGGVFAFGDAIFAGSLSGIHLAGPIVGMAADPAGGYWLVGSDGTVYPFGGAPALGSAPASELSAPIRAMAATPDGRGYWLLDTNGRVYVFGDAGYAGSASQSQ